MKPTQTRSQDIYPTGDVYRETPDLATVELHVRNPYSTGSPRWKAYNRALRDLGRCTLLIGEAYFGGGNRGKR